MSVSHTEAAVVARTKTVTRRLGWLFLKPGDRLTLCKKVMGRKAGEPLVRLAEVEIVSVRREPLGFIAREDVDREGVPTEVFQPDPQFTPHARYCGDCRVTDWIAWYARTFRVSALDKVTRIEWRYLAPEEEGPAS